VITRWTSAIPLAGIFEVAHILRVLRCAFDGCKRSCFI